MGPGRFAIALAALLSAAGLVVGPASGSCAFVVQWNDAVYVQADTDQAPRFGPPLGQAIVPPCYDQGQSGCSRRDEGYKIAIFRLPGIDPHIAFGAERQAFVAPGFLTSLPSHPLHEAIYGSPKQPNARSGWHCAQDPIAGLVGTVTQAGGSEVGIRFEGDRVQRQYGYTEVEIDAQTSVKGFDEYGLPHIVEGDHLRATVRECGSGRRYKVVAVSIAAMP